MGIIGVARRLVFVLAATLTCTGVRAQTAYQRQLMSTLPKCGQASQAGRHAEALKLLIPLIENPEFAGLPPHLRVSMYMGAASLTGLTGNVREAYRYELAGTALPDRSFEATWLWQNRLQYELTARTFEAGVATVEAMSGADPEGLNRVPLRNLYQLNAALREQKAEGPRERLLKLLSNPTFEPAEPGATRDGMQWEHVRLLAGKGQFPAAVAQARQITNPGMLMRLSLDRDLRAAVPADFDPKRALERQLQRQRDMAASHPGSLSLVIDTATTLRALDRAGEALALLDASRPAAGRTDVSYDDVAMQMNWWWEQRARTLAQLGRIDEAMAAIRQGTEIKEGGVANVSQVLNMADFQTEQRRYADALATLATLDRPDTSVSSYGVMMLRKTRACARARLGQAAGATADLVYVRAHEAEAPNALFAAQLCAGDLEAAAASMIARLDDPATRVGILEELSDYAASTVTIPLGGYAAGLRKAAMRPDVKAAVARAGGPSAFNVLFIP